MKQLTILVGLLLCSYMTNAQIQIHAENTAGGEIAKLEAVTGFPELLFSNEHGNVAKILLTESTNPLVLDDDNLSLQTLKEFGKINLLVSSGGVTINPNQIGNGAYVGINASSPTAPLTANIINGGEAATFKSTNTPKAYLTFAGNNGPGDNANRGILGIVNVNRPHDITLGTVAHPTTPSLTGNLAFQTRGLDRMTINKDGSVFIGSFSSYTNSTNRLNVCGNIAATGTITANGPITGCSDKRYKKDIKPITNALSSITSLQGVTYFWKQEFEEKHFTDTKQIGLIAQEVEKIFPELVFTDKDGYKSMDYVSLTAVLVEAVKEQQQEIEALKQQQLDISDFHERIASLEKSLQGQNQSDLSDTKATSNQNSDKK